MIMSKIAKKPILIPSGVKISVKDAVVNVEGPKGKTSHPVMNPIQIEMKDKELLLKRPSNSITDKSRHGTMYRSITNMIEGVTRGYQKTLLIEGVGFKAEMSGNKLSMNLGFTHIVRMDIPEGLSVKTVKPTELLVEGISKEKVGLLAARIRTVYEPEPYKGKGIRYSTEVVRRKAGKAVVK